MDKKAKEINDNPLEITKAEKSALKVYGGTVVPRYYNIDFCRNIHDFINSLFFEGMDSELTRIFEDYKYIDSRLLGEIESVIEIIENLYSAMYKYGKTIQSEQTGYRVDRKHSFGIMQAEERTPSNISTSGEKYNIRAFGKGHSVLLEFKIQPGTPCVDYQNALLGERYRYFNEREILIAPFCEITNIEELEDLEGFRRFRITVSAPEKAKALTKEEENNKKRQLELCYDWDLRSHVRLMLEEMRALQEEKGSINTLASAKQYFSDKEIEKYSKWKNAVLAYIKYRFREIALEIETALEEQSKYSPEDVLELSEQGIEMMNSEAVGEMLETTVTTGDKEIQAENKSIGEQ